MKTRLSLLFLILLLMMLGLLVLNGCGNPPSQPTSSLFGGQSAQARPQVMINPDIGSNLFEMVTHPEGSTNAFKEQITDFSFFAQQTTVYPEGCNICGNNSFGNLEQMAVFKFLQDRDIRIWVQVPVIKDWGCTAAKSYPVTAETNQRISATGAKLYGVLTDEFWVGLMPKPVGCGMTLKEVVQEIVNYSGMVHASSNPGMKIAQIESMNAVKDEKNFETRIQAELDAGFVPDAFYVDINMHLIETDPGQLASDLNNLSNFLQRKGIPFAPIFTSTPPLVKDAGGKIITLPIDDAFFALQLGRNIQWLRDHVRQPFGMEAYMSWSVALDGSYSTPCTVPETNPNCLTAAILKYK